MKELFKKRQSNFVNRCLKYLRYVFNDHFVLVLVFLLGFILVQYSQLLNDFPENPFWLVVFLVLLTLFLVFWGRSATYVEVADKYFLLVKEEELKGLVKRAQMRAFVLWTSVQSLLLILLAPLFLKLGLEIWQFVLVLLILALGKYGVLSWKSRVFYQGQGLSWEGLIRAEEERQQTILKFFSLFTTVKGISGSVKRRSYLDKLANLKTKGQETTWFHLYLRAFLRSGDYLSLTLRLTGLSLASLLFIEQPVVSAGLALLFNYLLLFQLLALYQHYDYHYLTAIYPLDRTLKKKNLKSLLWLISYLLLGLELLLSLSWQKAALLVAVMLVVNHLYLPYKLKKMID